jgi:hypothetical protein
MTGMQSNEADLKPLGLDPKELTALVDSIVQQDGVQERLKAELHDASQKLYSSRAELKEYISRAVSLLEGKYGKKSPKLQEFGIAPRQVNPHKGPRAKVPAGNTPADNNQPAKPSVEA